MLEERFRLMYLSKDGTGIRQVSLSWRKFCILSILLVVVFVLFTSTAIGLLTRFYHNYRIISLENDKGLLQRELALIKERVVLLGSQLAQVETTGDELRNLATLPVIDSDTRQVGVGGPSFSPASEFGYYPDGVNTASEIKFDLDKLERAVRLERSSLTEIAARLRNLEDERNHFPSIRPVLGGRIISRFGYRIDPFTNQPAKHEGIDIPVPKGTKVLAVADGRVILTRTKYTPNKSYGMEVVIDHGYGYKTR